MALSISGKLDLVKDKIIPRIENRDIIELLSNENQVLFLKLIFSMVIAEMNVDNRPFWIDVVDIISNRTNEFEDAALVSLADKAGF